MLGPHCGWMMIDGRDYKNHQPLGNHRLAFIDCFRNFKSFQQEYTGLAYLYTKKY